MLVEVDAPTFLGDISLSVQQKDGVEYLIAKWDRLSFEASELKDGLLYDMNYAVGKYSRTRIKLNFMLTVIYLICFNVVFSFVSGCVVKTTIAEHSYHNCNGDIVRYTIS